jgi:hypothetical protein
MAHVLSSGFLTLCRQQAAIIKNCDNANVHNKQQCEVTNRKYERFKFGGGQVYDCSSD